MDRCLSRLGVNAGPVLQIQTSHGSIPVSAAQITYIEVFDKLCIVHTAKQQFQTGDLSVPEQPGRAEGPIPTVFI